MFEPLESDLQEIAVKTLAYHESFKNSRILILGTNGFIGSWLRSSLLYLNEELKLNLEVTGIVRKQKMNTEIKVDSYNESTFRQWQMLNEGSRRVTHVFHCATNAWSPEGAIDIDLTGSVNLTERVIHEVSRNAFTPKFIHLSSGAVYGQSARKLGLVATSTVEEDHSNLDAYGRVKKNIEDVVIAATRKGLILGSNPRLFSFFGPGLPLEAPYAITSFIYSAINSNKIIIHGNPYTERTYLYPTDLVIQLMRLSVSPTLDVVHIGGSEKHTMQGIAEQVAYFWTANIEVLNDRNEEPNFYNPQVLNVPDQVDLFEGLSRWHKWLSRINQQ